MNAKQKRLLASLCTTPLPKAVPYRDVKGLLLALNCHFSEGEGSRIRFSRDGEVVTMHRPHPGKELKEYQLKEIRAFFEKVGIRP